MSRFRNDLAFFGRILLLISAIALAARIVAACPATPLHPPNSRDSRAGERIQGIGTASLPAVFESRTRAPLARELIRSEALGLEVLQVRPRQ